MVLKLLGLSAAVLYFYGPLAFGAVVVNPARELMITDIAVVNDPVRTKGCGAWTFCKMMTGMAGTTNVSDFTLAWLNTWKVDRVITGDTARARPAVQQRIIDAWPKLSTGKLDMTKSPFRLLAIVNRIDLRNAAAGHSGEGRFIYGLVSPTGAPLQMTVIFEFKLWNTVLTEKQWSAQWHALGSSSLVMGTTYNAALQKVTDRFVVTRVAGRPNGSAIGQVRTNEIVLASPWELREFVLSGTVPRLVHTTVKMNPAQALNRTAALANYINANEAAILKEKHVIKAPLTVGIASPVSAVWNAPGIRNPEARHKFALNTCNGCHQAETGTSFLHVTNRSATSASRLSAFFNNIAITDPFGVRRNFNELSRRKLNFEALLTIQAQPVAASAMMASGASGAAAPSSPSQVLASGMTAEQQLEATNTPEGSVH